MNDVNMSSQVSWLQRIQVKKILAGRDFEACNIVGGGERHG